MLTMFDPELYIPFTFLSFKIETLIVGMNPMLFHTDQLILHVVNALLVAWIIGRLTGSRIAGYCMAAVFAVHPLNAEAAVWLSARKDLLATFFTLLSIVFVLQSIDRENRWFWILSVIFFVLALLSKISVVALPLFILIVLLRERFTMKSAAMMLAPYLIAALLLGIVAVLGKGGVLASTPLLDRIVLAGYAISLSIGHFFIPAHLTLYYALPAINATSTIVALIPLLFIAIAIACWKRAPLISIGLAWFFVFILPTVFNIQTDVHASGVTFASDRYLYLPMIGLLIALVGLTFMIRSLLDASIARWSAMIAMLIALVIFVPMTRAQVATWNDAQTLFSHAIIVSPASVQARISLAETLKKQNNLQDAFAVLKDGLAYGDDTRLHLEAGVLYAAADDVTHAVEEFSTVRSMDAHSAAAYDGLAALQAHAGNIDQAKLFYEKAIQLEPADIGARIALAALLHQSGDASGARHQLDAALKNDPSSVDALNAMAILLISQGHALQAQVYSHKAALLTLPR